MDAEKLARYNKNPISARQGHAFIEGIEVMDGIKFEIKFTPEVGKSRTFNELSSSSRYLGYEITGTITRRRSTNFAQDLVKKYKETGVTPEFTIQGIVDDPGSDYYSDNGTDTVTAVGCVFTGDISLISIDTGGEFVDDVLTFNAKEIL